MPSNKPLSDKKKCLVVFVLVVIAMSLWSGLAVFALSEFLNTPLFSLVSAALTALLMILFGTKDISALPLRRSLIHYTGRLSKSRARTPMTLGLIIVAIVPIYEISNLVACQIKKDKYFALLSDGWNKHSNPTSGPKFLGQAHSLFPDRTETYFIYQKGRQYYTRKSGLRNMTELKKYASSFLSANAKLDSPTFCMLFFCCSCSHSSYFRLLPTIAMFESADFAQATANKPAVDHVDEYLLWLYHMSERQDLTDSYYSKKLYPQMKKAVQNAAFRPSPIYPLLVDHVMQIESHNSCPTKQLVAYTEDIILSYRHLANLMFVAPPNKTLTYFIIRILASYKTEQIPFRSTVNKVNELLARCADYRNKLKKLFSEEELLQIAKLMYGMEQMNLRDASDVQTYLKAARNQSWLRFQPF